MEIKLEKDHVYRNVQLLVDSIIMLRTIQGFAFKFVFQEHGVFLHLDNVLKLQCFVVLNGLTIRQICVSPHAQQAAIFMRI